MPSFYGSGLAALYRLTAKFDCHYQWRAWRSVAKDAWQPVFRDKGAVKNCCSNNNRFSMAASLLLDMRGICFAFSFQEKR